MTLISPDTPASKAKLPAMPLWLRALFLVSTALTVCLFAMVFAPSSRGYGGPGGWGNALFYLIGAVLLAGFIFWSFLTWLIYRSLHDRTRGQRVGITLLLFLLPPVLLASNMGMDWLKGSPGGRKFEAESKQAVTLVGVVFPPGSELEYEEDGHFGRTLIGATASTPLALGTLQVTGIWLSNPPDESHLRLNLPSPQSIDGWFCSGNDNVKVIRKDGTITLEYCMLVGQTIANSTWPPGTRVYQTTAGWTVFASSIIDPSGAETCTSPIMVAGVPYVQVTVNYDKTRQKLTTDDGTRCKKPEKA